MKVTKNPEGALSIEGLSPGQFAYLVGVIGMSHSLVDRDARFDGEAVVPEARNLHMPLSLAAKRHGLDGLVRDVERSQELCQRRTASEERLEVAS